MENLVSRTATKVLTTAGLTGATTQETAPVAAVNEVTLISSFPEQRATTSCCDYRSDRFTVPSLSRSLRLDSKPVH
ncbi:hypothetical protein [Nostoc sp.]